LRDNVWQSPDKSGSHTTIDYPGLEGFVNLSRSGLKINSGRVTRAIIPKLQWVVPRYNARPGQPPNFQSHPMDEARLINIEEKITFQEDLVEELNKTVYQQQQKLERLEGMCIALAGQVRSLAEAGSHDKSPANERPPHY